MQKKSLLYIKPKKIVYEDSFSLDKIAFNPSKQQQMKMQQKKYKQESKRIHDIINNTLNTYKKDKNKNQKKIINRIQQVLKDKYKTGSKDYEKLLINALIFKKKSHILSKYNEFLYSYMTKETIKQYYTMNEIYKRLPKCESYFRHHNLLLMKPIFASSEINHMLFRISQIKASNYYKLKYGRNDNKNNGQNNKSLKNNLNKEKESKDNKENKENIIFNEDIKESIDNIDNYSTSMTYESNDKLFIYPRDLLRQCKTNEKKKDLFINTINNNISDFSESEIPVNDNENHNYNSANKNKFTYTKTLVQKYNPSGSDYSSIIGLFNNNNNNEEAKNKKIVEIKETSNNKKVKIKQKISPFKDSNYSNKNFIHFIKLKNKPNDQKSKCKESNRTNIKTNIRNNSNNKKERLHTHEINIRDKKPKKESKYGSIEKNNKISTINLRSDKYSKIQTELFRKKSPIKNINSNINQVNTNTSNNKLSQNVHAICISNPNLINDVLNKYSTINNITNNHKIKKDQIKIISLNPNSLSKNYINFGIRNKQKDIRLHKSKNNIINISNTNIDKYRQSVIVPSEKNLILSNLIKKNTNEIKNSIRDNSKNMTNNINMKSRARIKNYNINNSSSNNNFK